MGGRHGHLLSWKPQLPKGNTILARAAIVLIELSADQWLQLDRLLFFTDGKRRKVQLLSLDTLPTFCGLRPHFYLSLQLENLYLNIHTF